MIWNLHGYIVMFAVVPSITITASDKQEIVYKWYAQNSSSFSPAVGTSFVVIVVRVDKGDNNDTKPFVDKNESDPSEEIQSSKNVQHDAANEVDGNYAEKTTPETTRISLQDYKKRKTIISKSPHLSPNVLTSESLETDPEKFKFL